MDREEKKNCSDQLTKPRDRREIFTQFTSDVIFISLLLERRFPKDKAVKPNVVMFKINDW